MYIKKCKYIVNSILTAATPDEYIDAARELSVFYSAIVTSEKYLSQTNKVAVKGGLALSGLDAAACVDDYFRTVSFIKGVYKALSGLINDFPDETIKILYAGTGPYATLLLPLLQLFDKSRLSVIFLDINASSIESVQNLSSLMELDDYNLRYAVADATTYNIPENFPVDIVVSETMHYGLTLEPQVAIVKNLASQMRPHAILIPQEIHIDFGYSFYANEPFINSFTDTPKGYNKLQPYKYRKIVDRLFTISKELFSDKIYTTSNFTSKFYQLPDEYSNFPDVCIFTSITIFDDIKLDTAESLITNPYCITSLLNLKGKNRIQLVYDFSDIPTWSLR